MQVSEERQEIQSGLAPSLNDIISSNTDINSNNIIIQKTTTTETVEPTTQTQYSYTKGGMGLGNTLIEEEGEGDLSQEMNEFKTMKKEGTENTRYEQTANIEPETTTKVVKRVIQTEQPVTETTYYEKRVTTKTTTTRGGDVSQSQNSTVKYTNSNINTNTNISNTTRSGGYKSQNQTSNIYSRPSPATRGNSTENNIYLRNYDSNRTVSRNKNEPSNNNRYGTSNYSSNYSFQNNRNNQNNQKNQPQKKMVNSQSFVGNRYQPKKQEISSYNRYARSPESEIKRKTIYRGDPIKNIQITHIINSSKPSDFHITENLDTDSLQTNPIEISKVDRVKLKKTGISSWTSSCQDDVKPIVKNLKGKTTVFQHAQGIGMTNEKKENINPQFYCSEIKKLNPIVKEKEKEKVEYMTFRNTGSDKYNLPNTTRSNFNSNYNSNYNRGTNNSIQIKSYNNSNYNTYASNSRGSKANSLKTYGIGNVNRGTYSGNRDSGEIVKETRTKVQMGSRSQYRGGNPTSYITNEKRVYNSNTFFNN